MIRQKDTHWDTPRNNAKTVFKVRYNIPSGTGLGLFQKSIIEAHGGKMWASNNDANQEKEGGGGGGHYSRLINL